MDFFSDTGNPNRLVSESVAESDKKNQSNHSIDNPVENATQKPQPSYRLTWKVEDGQLVRHWIEV